MIHRMRFALVHRGCGKSVKGVEHPMIQHRLEGSVVRHRLWKPWKRSKRAHDPWGFPPDHGDQLLVWRWFMANTRRDAPAVHIRDP